MILRHIKIFSLLILIALFGSSCKIAGYHSAKETPGIDSIYVFESGFTKALYSTEINIYGHNFSGLTLIKKTDNAYRVVAMSELGMKYFDLEFPIDEYDTVTKHYIMEVLNKKLLVNMIISDLRLLFNCPCLCSCKPKVNNGEYAADCKKLWYVINKEGVISSVVKPRFLLSDKQIITLEYNGDDYPSEISIDRGKINFRYTAIAN